MLKLGPKALEAMKSLTREEILAAIADMPEASADDPIYTRGFAIGEMRSIGSSRRTAGASSPRSKSSSTSTKPTEETANQPQVSGEKDKR